MFRAETKVKLPYNGHNSTQNAPFFNPRPDSESSRRDLASEHIKTRFKAMFNFFSLQMD